MQKIAIIRKNGIGDFIAGTVPLCNYLIDKYGDVELHFFMTKRNACVAKLFYPNAYVHVFAEGNKYWSHWRMAQQWKHLHFDLGISPVPENPKLNNFFLWALNAKERYGRYTENWLSKNTINHYVEKYDEDDVSTSAGLLTLRLFEPDLKEIPRKFLPVLKKEWLPHYNTKHTGMCILVEVSNARNTSQLTNEKIMMIIEQISKKQQCFALITALDRDRKKAETLAKMLSVETEIFITNDFKKYLGFVNAANLILCGDGGLMHVAGALQKKAVVLFAKTPVGFWRPLGGNIKILSDDEDVNNISDESIIAALESLI